MQRLAPLLRRALQQHAQQPCLESAASRSAAWQHASSSGRGANASSSGSGATAQQPWWSGSATTRGVHVVVNVHKNNVDQALTRLRRESDALGLRKELAKREAFRPSDDATFAQKRRVFNAKMGAKIRERLKWVMKRRKLK